MGDVAVRVDCVAETPPAVTTTVAVDVIATVLIVADTVFEPAAVDASVPVATPFASVVPTGWVSVLPVVGVAASVTVAVCVIATVLIVADTVFDPVAVDESVPVATPLASVVPVGWVRVFPAVGAAR